MRLKNISIQQEIKALVANKITLPLIILGSLKDGKKIDKETIVRAINELNSIAESLDKEWTSKK